MYDSKRIDPKHIVVFYKEVLAVVDAGQVTQTLSTFLDEQNRKEQSRFKLVQKLPAWQGRVIAGSHRFVLRYNPFLSRNLLRDGPRSLVMLGYAPPDRPNQINLRYGYDIYGLIVMALLLLIVLVAGFLCWLFMGTWLFLIVFVIHLLWYMLRGILQYYHLRETIEELCCPEF